MTATAPSTAAEATEMAQAPNQRTDPPAEATAAEPAAAGAQSRLRAILGDNPLLPVMASGMIALLLFMFNNQSNRLDRLEDTVAAGFAAQDAKIDEVDRRLTAQIAELDRKLTALIAALNKTDEVDSALEGRLLDSDPSVAGPDDAPG